MKKKFYTKFFIAMLAFTFVAMNLFSQAPPVTTVGAATLDNGVYTVPVTVTGFSNVGNISLGLNYDVTKLLYTGVTVNAGLDPSAVVTSPTTDQSGEFKMSFTSATGVALPDGAVLLTLTFTAQPAVQGLQTPLTWSTLQGHCDITPPSPDSFTPEIDVSNLSTYFIPGSITVPDAQISGDASVCPGTSGVVYSFMEGMLAYNWTVSDGGIITAGNGTSSITVTWNTSGAKTVSLAFTDPFNGPQNRSFNLISMLPNPTIAGPLDPISHLPATLGNGITSGQVYTTEPSMTNYQWVLSPAGQITAGAGTNQITVTWTNPTGQQTVSVNYTDEGGCTALQPTVLIINYYPFAAEIDPTTIIKYQDPLPHFAAGLRVNAKGGGALLIKEVPVQQVALSTGTPTATGIVGDPSTPNAGKGTYAAYAISTDNGTTFGPAMWPAQTIEARQGNQLTVQYRNDLFGIKYDNFNILADQTLLLNGYVLNGDPQTEPYRGDIPMVVHLHGGEMPSNSDGGPTAWFTPGYNLLGPGFASHASSLATYPNQQEATTLWYHPHDQGLTRINVYTGLAGFYFLRGDAEENAHLPGWSGDDKVREVTPAGKTPTFNGSNTYLPEIEVAIQDRMFNVNGELYWPVNPTNPDIHPFWTPEFFGDVFTVNGKTWPYLSVAPRKYRFRMLDGCNARFLNMWLENAANGAAGPAITVIGTDGGLLQNPKVLASGSPLFMAPGERYDIVIDFSGITAGTVFTLKNDAPAPYPTGDPVIPGLTDQIMQFVVNGELVSASNPSNPGTDNSQVPSDLRPNNPLVQLTDFAGHLQPGVTPAVKRELILNEVSAAGGPAAVMINNSHFDAVSPIPGEPRNFGGPTELPKEGTIELFTIINTTVDAHPMHIHLLQWQLVSRQTFNRDAYMAAYSAAWIPTGLPEWPAGLGYPGGSGSPYPYNQLNADGAVGGNPAVSGFLTGSPFPALPQENGWKDDIIALPGYVMTFAVRVAPTDRPVGATQQQLLFPFDPSLGPGYVWHCHIIDHEDMDMMRPLPIAPNALRYPQITTQPAAVSACVADAISFTVVATSATEISYQWQISTNNGTDWTDLGATAPYSGVQTATLTVSPTDIPLNGNLYRCVLTNIDGVTTSDAAKLTVTNCTISGTILYNNTTHDPLSGMTVTINGKSATTDATGAFTVSGVSSGVHAVTVDAHSRAVGAINSTDAGLVNYWFTNPTPIPFVKFMAGDVNFDLSITSADAQRIQRYFVLDAPFDRTPWQFHSATGTGTTNPPAFTATVSGVSVAGFGILANAEGDFNGSFRPNAAAKGEGVSLVRMLNVDTRKVAAGKSFDLPIKAVSDMEVGAISLILNLSSDLVDVENVVIKGSKTPVTFAVKENQLRIGWNSLAPVNVKADGDLIILKLRTSAAFVEGESFQITMVEDPLNELASGMFTAIDGVTLKSDKVTGSTSAKEKLGNELALSLYPNPTKAMTTINYVIPVDGKVTIQIINSIGIVVNTLVEEQKTGGKYSVTTDVSSLPYGIYMAKIKLHGSGPEQIRTIKFVVNK